MSRVVVFGKLPPIQGGVAARTVELVGALRAAKHEVIVVTNASAAGPTHRSSFMESDELILRQRCGGATIKLLDADNAWHIPYSEAFETRLLGRAIAECSSSDLIIGSYFQPYGVAAALAARLTDKPCVLLHAGSDVGRLARQQEYREAYRAIFKGAIAISTSPTSRPLLECVVSPDAILPLRAGYQLPSYFNKPKASVATTVADFSARAAASLIGWSNQLPLARGALAGLSNDFSDAEFVLGVYGKAGEQKGTFDLLAAFSRLKVKRRVRLILLTGGSPRSLTRLIEVIAGDPKLSETVTLWPFVPPWLVPNFIDLCDAVAFLERGFEITVHGPQVPKEVMWRGKPLILSDEIVGKQGFRGALRPWVNFIPAGDPRQINPLKEVLEQTILCASLREIGIAGRGVVRAFYAPAHPRDNIVETLVATGFL